MTNDDPKPSDPTKWCKTCGYVLDGLSENRCPECGRGFDPANRRTFRGKPPASRRRKFFLRSVVVIFILVLAQPIILFWRPLMEWQALRRNPYLTASNSVEWTPTPYHRWCVRWIERLHIPPPSTVVAIATVAGPTDADLRAIRHFPNLWEFAVSNPMFADIDLAQLADIVHINKIGLGILWLDNTRASTEGLAYFIENSNVKFLAMSNSKLSKNEIFELNNLREGVQVMSGG
jgi:hypothetical protein